MHHLTLFLRKSKLNVFNYMNGLICIAHGRKERFRQCRKQFFYIFMNEMNEAAFILLLIIKIPYS